MYQEFFLSLCEIKDNRLIEAHDGGYLEVLCVGIINNIWGKRERVKTYKKGSTSALYESSDHLISIGEDGIDEEHLGGQTPDYDTQIDHEYNLTQNIIETEFNSSNSNDRYKARVFFYSNTLYKNTKQFSKHAGIPYPAVLKVYNAFKDKLKKQLEQCRIS